MMRISVGIALHGHIRYVARNKRTEIGRAQFLAFEGLPGRQTPIAWRDSEPSPSGAAHGKWWR